MSVKNKIQALEYYTLDSSGIVPGAWSAINAPGTTEACSIIRLINDSNQDMAVSYDGATYNDLVLAGDILQLGFQANSQPSSQVALFPKGTVVYVTKLVAAAASGTIYFTGYYQK